MQLARWSSTYGKNNKVDKTTIKLTSKRPKRKLYIILIVIILAIGAIIYGLADRYLIEHVEIVVSDDQVTTDSASKGDGTKVNATYDDWNYTSDDIQIKIDQVQTGSGSDQITYYVADVKLQDSNNLLSAFADNSFGRNIIENTSEIASNNDAIFAINGDYYGFRNDGVIIRNGTLYRDSPVRTALALFNDGAIQSFDETQISSSELLADGVTNTLSFGPVLIEDGKMVEDFSHVMIDTNFGNRSIQGANPRTGIGMIAPNHYIFIVVDGRKEGYSRGMTLPEFAQVFADLGCTEAYNLDGGGSSTMYFMGRIVNNPQGKNRERGVSDILYIKER
ncbi:phosphodiester glycosidase family protein [Paenibacillus anaericanus]|uniref:Phosphodiester glycosidase family protein n=1 Tax=Paenibacillus anaericanus TaxID=170367 RepID=A0A433Y738_9BACL|nr:phosphodiester glycosidase family protein [Paenibacillus anaericanus]RUT45194.1 phosphodiester glycosidase family protein [Paenibacillus anaericanus]